MSAEAAPAPDEKPPEAKPAEAKPAEAPKPVGPRDSTRTAASPPAPEPEPELLPLEEWPLLPGWKLLRKLGQGGQGSVFLAESTDGLGKQTAIKLFPKENKASYTRELEAWRRVEEIRRQHNTPHLVEGYQAGTTPEGLTYVVMAYFEKASLADRIATDGPMPASAAARAARQVLAALDLLHRHGLFHRDVKPQNLLLGSDGIVRLADYGLSKPLGTSVTGSCTPAFAAPEQLAGEAGADGVKIDIYGVGATLFSLLTGKPPVPGRPDVFLLEKLKVPRPLQAVLLRSLNPDPAVRFDTAAAFARALADADPQSSGRLAVPASEIAVGQVAGNEVVTPTVASGSGLESPFVRPPEADPDAITRGSPLVSTVTRQRTARAKALVGAAALLACGALVAEGIRGQSGAIGTFIGGGIGGNGSSSVVQASPGAPTPAPSSKPTPSTPSEAPLVVRSQIDPLPIDGRVLEASDRGLAFVGSGTALLPRGSRVAVVRGHVAYALPWEGESVLVARASGALDLVDASSVRTLEPAPEAGPRGARPRALAAHAGSRRVAVARRSGAVVLETLDGARVASRATLPATGGGLVTALAFDESGDRLALASLGPDGVGHLAVFRCPGEPALEKAWEDRGPLAVAWLSSATLAVGGLHGEVATVDVASGRRVRTLAAFEDEVSSLVRVPGTELVLALGDDRKLEPAPFPGAISVRDSGGTPLWFAARPKPRLLGWSRPELLAPGDAVPRRFLDAGSFDPEHIWR